MHVGAFWVRAILHQQTDGCRCAYRHSCLATGTPASCHSYLTATIQVADCALSGKAPLREQDGQVVFGGWDFGRVIHTGCSLQEHRNIMAAMPVLLLLEGGPGATSEAKAAYK